MLQEFREYRTWSEARKRSSRIYGTAKRSGSEKSMTWMISRDIYNRKTGR